MYQLEYFTHTIISYTRRYMHREMGSFCKRRGCRSQVFVCGCCSETTWYQMLGFRGLEIHDGTFGGFLKCGYRKWMVFNGQSHSHGWFWGPFQETSSLRTSKWMYCTIQRPDLVGRFPYIDLIHIYSYMYVVVPKNWVLETASEYTMCTLSGILVHRKSLCLIDYP